MRLRDYFAAQVIARLVYADTGEVHSFADVGETAQNWAKKAYIIADAMLKAR